MASREEQVASANERVAEICRKENFVEYRLQKVERDRESLLHDVCQRLAQFHTQQAMQRRNYAPLVATTLTWPSP